MELTGRIGLGFGSQKVSNKVCGGGGFGGRREVRIMIILSTRRCDRILSVYVSYSTLLTVLFCRGYLHSHDRFGLRQIKGGSER